MEIKSTIMGQEEIKTRKENRTTFFYKSDFKFLNSHRGYRPGKMHLFVGMPGGGKSTLRNSLITDFVKNNPGKKVFIWLSEESEDDFKTDMVTNDDAVKDLDNVYIYSELDNLEDFDDTNEDTETFIELLIKSGCDLFIFDNITTSRVYGSSFKQNEYFAKQLKGYISQQSPPSVIFAHTKSDIKHGINSLIDMNDIRGSKSLVNLAEFEYIMQTFHLKEEIYTTIRTVKHRGQNPKVKMFVLVFSTWTKTYHCDKEVDFDGINDLYKNQNRLGKN